MESLARKYWKDKDKIAKLTSYGSYLDCEFITSKYPDDESHIVGDLAEYVYDLEEKIEEQEKEIKDRLNQIRDLHSMQIELVEALYYFETKYYGKWTKKEIKEFCQQKQNQTAIKELEKVFRDFNHKIDDEFADNDMKYITLDIEDVNFYLQDKIKSLKGDDNETI